MIELTKASFEDRDILYSWQVDPKTRKYFYNPKVPNYLEHCEWLKEVLASKDILLFLIESEKKK